MTTSRFVAEVEQLLVAAVDEEEFGRTKVDIAGVVVARPEAEVGSVG